VASGLCLYFIASSLWGLGERRLLKKAKNDDAPGASGQTALLPTRGPSSGGTNGSPGKKGSKAKRKR